MAKNKYYAVRKGRVPGIYRTWSECQKQVTGYPGAVFKGFVTEEEAQSFLHPGQSAKAKETHISHTAYPYAYVDGSYFQGIYGFGGFLKLSDEEEVVLQGSGDHPDLAKMHNVAGELLGCIKAVKEAEKRKIAELSVFYDYQGIESWVTADWAAKQAGTQQYRDFMNGTSVKLHFIKVKGHTGVEGNERADSLAKEAVSKKISFNQLVIE